MIVLINALLDVVGEDEDHALSGLLELASDVVSKYEREQYAVESSTPKDSLRFLIEVHKLNQLMLRRATKSAQFF
jgi:HTH-type transcriptional regulator/antitoxin HigA